MEDRLLAFLFSHCHFECREGPGDKPPITTLSRNCHVLNLSIFLFVRILHFIILLTSTVLYMLQGFARDLLQEYTI